MLKVKDSKTVKLSAKFKRPSIPELFIHGVIYQLEVYVQTTQKEGKSETKNILAAINWENPTRYSTLDTFLYYWDLVVPGDRTILDSLVREGQLPPLEKKIKRLENRNKKLKQELNDVRKELGDVRKELAELKKKVPLTPHEKRVLEAKEEWVRIREEWARNRRWKDDWDREEWARNRWVE